MVFVDSKISDSVTFLNAILAGTTKLTGGQLAYPSVQIASSDPNTLDDYEEGTWTPNVGGNATYTTQIGRFVKWGKYTWVMCDLVINVLGTGSLSILSGLPFTSANISLAQPIAVGYYASLAVSPIFIAGIIANNATTVTFTDNTAAAATMNSPISLFGNGAEIRFLVVYETTG